MKNHTILSKGLIRRIGRISRYYLGIFLGFPGRSDARKNRDDPGLSMLHADMRFPFHLCGVRHKGYEYRVLFSIFFKFSSLIVEYDFRRTCTCEHQQPH